jgi:SAM-dependent methyltransferase
MTTLEVTLRRMGASAGGLAALLDHHARQFADARERFDRTLSPNDEMLHVPPDAYFVTGLSGLAVIVQALIAAGKPEAERILDYPCGHGRVMRMLRARFPDAWIVGSDVDRDGVDFCAETFGSIPVYAPYEPRLLVIDETFDLIWVGSLFTHLDEPVCHELMEACLRHLAPGGVLVFTTAGRYVATREDAIRESTAGFRERGFGYRESPGSPGYGITYAAPEWVMRFLELFPLQLLGCWERAWNDFQDVYALLNRPVTDVWKASELV